MRKIVQKEKEHCAVEFQTATVNSKCLLNTEKALSLYMYIQEKQYP